MTDVRSFAAALCLLAPACLPTLAASAQEPEQRVHVTVENQKQPVEEQITDEYKAKRLRRDAQEDYAAEESARIADTSPRGLLRRAQTFYVESKTSFFTPAQLTAALGKRDEFVDWELAVVDGWNQREVADVLVTIDRPLWTYTYTYQLTARGTGVVLATGKLTAFDGNAAAPRIAKKIVEAIRTARGESEKKKKR